MFYGEKLEQLRELYGFSRSDLAQKLDVSEQTIGQYENDQITPRFDVMRKLPSIFNVNANFFERSSFIEKDVISEGSIAYRTKDRNSRKKINNEMQYLAYAKTFIDYFESFVTSNISGFESLKYQVDKIQKNGCSISDISDCVKRYYNLDNKDLMSKLEQSGITILEKDLGSTVDAYSGFTKDNKPYIILGNLKKTAVRRNFDLAHELGHLLLHSYVVMSDLTDREHTQIEAEANEFAASLLMPEAKFIRDFSNVLRKTNPDYYLQLKKKYLVSIGALEYRAYKLKLISYQGNRYFWSQMSKKQYRSFEPLDDQISPVKPGKIKTLLSFLLNNGILTVNGLTEQFGITPEFLIYLFDLKSDFFDKYSVKKQKIKNDRSNIIDFNFARERLG